MAELTRVSDILPRLVLVNRAYNLLYALGEEPDTVRQLDADEAQWLVDTAQRVLDGKAESAFEQRVQAMVKPALLRYVATGRFQ